jgi:transcription elongation factor Elf1
MPHGPLDHNHDTHFAVECPACGHYTEKPLPWLKRAEIMDCGACGMVIDLASGERREEIDKLYEITLRTVG